MSKSVLPVLSSKSFIVSSLSCRLLIHFEFIFVYDIKRMFSFCSLACSCPVFSTTYWRDCLFSIVFSCLLCCRTIGHMCMGLFLGFLSSFLDLCFCFCTSTVTVWITMALWYSLKSGNLTPPALFLFLRIALAICGVSCFHTG